MVRKKDLEKEIDKLNEILAKKGHNREKTSMFFFLLNSNEMPRNQTEKESSFEYMKEIVKSVGDNLEEFVEFKDKSHSFTKEYIKDVKIKFALEQGIGRKKKDGSYSQYAGQVHAHALTTIKHTSNISINNDKLQEFVQERFNYYYGHNGFVGVKWVPGNMLNEYMTKSKRYENGYEWKSL
jgi:hypothetical protein